MKRVLLSVFVASLANCASAQYSVFMKMLENKKICNKEDELTWFLQTNAFDRDINGYYSHQYVVGHHAYTASVLTQNECYVIYHTNEKKDYQRIFETISATCNEELAKDKTPSYICNKGRLRDVQVIFNGFSEKDNNYEIKVYQDPEEHQKPYYPSDLIKAGTVKKL